MTPEAQGAVERAAEVLAAHELRAWSCRCMGWTFQPRTTNYGGHDVLNGHRRHVAEALAAANLLATPPTAGHDETAVRAHAQPEGDCASCAACAACNGDCGTCPYAARAAASADMAGESGGTDG